MGNFGGHALPGSFFIIFAMWYLVRLYQLYYSSKQRNTRFTSRVMMSCPCLPSRLKVLPIEAFVKIFLISVGFSLEIYTGMRHGKFVAVGNGQHATMFFFFGFTGIVDILHYYRAPIPPNTEYISYFIAFMVEGLLFKFHLHGRSELDVLLHTFLVYVIFAGAVSVLVEMRFRHHILASVMRSYLMLLQGTWFWQVAFILFNPIEGATPWKQDDHEHMMIATLYFTWHCGVNFVIVLLIGAVIACCYGHTKVDHHDGDEMSMKRLIHTGANGQTFVSLNDESDSDVEFQKPVAK
ncbi:transmembrane protein 45B-like [Haliotis asinina]|uniref:transmembrane protein 45B-like n=1 Tax=Haliotis asinina TaxID=109174 RepID=UPI0035325205